MEDPLSARAMALLPDLAMQPAADWRPPLLLLQAKPQTMANRPGQAIRLVLKETDSKFVSQQAKQRPVLLLVTQATLRDLFLHSARLQERQLHPEEDSPVPSGRVRQCSQCPGPSAFFRGTPAG